MHRPITMDGEWAYAFDPHTKVRILCVDAHGRWPVRSLDAMGHISQHNNAGDSDYGNGRNLVPLRSRRKPVEAWALEVDGQAISLFKDGAVAKFTQAARPGSRLVRLIEDPEWRP